MSGKHTAGPWEYSGGGIWGKSPFNARVRLADIVFHNSINAVDGEANGHLIASALELFEALKAIVNSDMAMREEDEGNVSPELDRARSALRKASGEG